ncbi:hypothetical protein J6590_058179 [Homalodisca vitripennis]|nr:hypothetical protein J6590_058179 [Homalodisca vitripennis]
MTRDKRVIRQYDVSADGRSWWRWRWRGGVYLTQLINGFSHFGQLAPSVSWEELGAASASVSCIVWNRGLPYSPSSSSVSSSHHSLFSTCPKLPTDLWDTLPFPIRNTFAQLINFDFAFSYQRNETKQVALNVLYITAELKTGVCSIAGLDNWQLNH